MIFVLGFCVIVIIAVTAIVRSKKPLKLIISEAKYEILYNAVGSKGLIQDYMMRGRNKTELIAKSGKTAVITGGNRGIGSEVIRMLLKCDVNVIMGCRNVNNAENMLKKFRDDGIKTGKLTVLQLDISSLDSIRSFAETVKNKFPAIHFLINNAGIMFGPYVETKDGYESQFSTNYLGHFLLTHLLLPELKNGGKEKERSRIVNVSSCAHYVGNINFVDINNRQEYIPGVAYAQSKLAQIMFSNYLNELLKKRGDFVQTCSVHPGIVNTELFDGTTLKNKAPWVPHLLFKSPEQGAISIVHSCISPSLEGNGGTYINNCEIFAPSETASSTELQEKLFNFTKDLLKIEEFGK